MISQHSKYGHKNVENPNSVRGFLRHQILTACSFSVFSYTAASAASVASAASAASVVCLHPVADASAEDPEFCLASYSMSLFLVTLHLHRKTMFPRRSECAFKNALLGILRMTLYGWQGFLLPKHYYILDYTIASVITSVSTQSASITVRIAAWTTLDG